jgi:hypothetical protein
LRAAAVRRDALLGGAPAVRVRFALRGRSLALVAVFGSAPPGRRALREANVVLASLRVRPRGVDPATRTRLRRPLRTESLRRCRPAPRVRAAARVAWPVGRLPVVVALGSPGSVALLRDDIRRGRWYLHKTLWAIAPSYPGPVLARAVGRDGQVPLDSGRTRELWVDPAPPGSRRWRHAPSTTWLPGPGCYAFQVDGTSFSQTIVFRARL